MKRIPGSGAGAKLGMGGGGPPFNPGKNTFTQFYPQFQPTTNPGVIFMAMNNQADQQPMVSCRSIFCYISLALIFFTFPECSLK